MAKKVKYNGLPVYRVEIGDGVDGMTKVSLVDLPAVEKDFQAFKAEKAATSYAVEDEEKRIVRGVLIRADFPIYRYNKEKKQAYYIVFTKETIREIAEQYLADGRANNVNEMHEDGTDVEGVEMVQLFIKDTGAGVDPAGFEDVEDGSLFAEYHVLNDDVWAQVKDGTFRGFSIEIEHYLNPIEEGEETFEGADIFALISKHINMPNFLNKLRAAVANITGSALRTDTSDKGAVAWDGDEDLKVGDVLYLVDEKDERTVAPDGDYTLSDGTVATVTDGAVSAIKAPEGAGDDGSGEGETTDTTKAAAQTRRSKLEASYNEKQRKIAEAIGAARNDNPETSGGYLVDAGEDFAIWAYYGEDTGWADKFYRYKVTWNEDGSASVSDPVECRIAYVPLDFDDSKAFDGAAAGGAAAEEGQPEQTEQAAEVVQLRADLDALIGMVQTIAEAVGNQKTRLSKLEKTPAGAPAAEAFKAAAAAGKSGVSDPVKALQAYLSKN